MATAAQTKFIRPDGKDKVTGLGRYTADLTMTGMLHACFRYADHAHARIRSIDASRARALPGVFCVLTALLVLRIGRGRGRPALAGAPA